MNGVFVLDKPKGLSSQQALSRIRRFFKEKRGGYSGTLDPFATGVLPIYLGEATKIIPFIPEKRKTYRAKLLLGLATDTLDLTGRELEKLPVPLLSEEKIHDCFHQFLGPQQQTPPQFSALKFQGKPLYRYARAGEKIELKPRSVEIFSIRLLGYDQTSIEFEACVSPGTYIRVLAADLARALNTCGHLTELQRTESGFFNLKRSIKLELLEKIKEEDSYFYSVEELFDRVLNLEDPVICERILKGQKISLRDIPPILEEKPSSILVKTDNKLLAIMEKIEGRGLKPLRILNFSLEG